MSLGKRLVGWLIAAALVGVIGACGAGDVAPAADEPAPAADEPPTRTPRPTLTPLATRVEEVLQPITTADGLLGAWGYTAGQSTIGIYYLFNNDGTFHFSGTPTRARLVESPGSVGEFWFEDSRFHIKSGDTESYCPGVGVYEVQQLVDQTLRFVVVDDQCDQRKKMLAGENHEPVVLD